jgi:CubicO group peptidase (beta-lactamase class C family)
MLLAGTDTGKTFKTDKSIELPCANGVCKMASGLIYVVKQGQVLTNISIGYADYLDKVLFTPHTQIYIGSLKKQFIAAAILKLMNEGKINLYEPVSKYIQFNTQLTAKDPSWIHKTTIHHLLTHVSGVWDTAAIPLNKITPEPYIDRIYVNATAPSSPPTFVYSNVAYELLSIIINNLTGLTVAEYINRYFLIPLQMNNTKFHGPEAPFRIRQTLCPYLCYPYYFSYKDECVKSSYNPFEFRNFGQFDMVSTAEDLCKWNTGLHSGKVFGLSESNTRLLLDLMRGLYTMDEEGSSYYGYGIKTHVRDEQTVYWHEGLVTGASLYLEYIPDTDTHIVVCSNNHWLWLNTKTGKYILDTLTSN